MSTIRLHQDQLAGLIALSPLLWITSLLGEIILSFLLPRRTISPTVTKSKLILLPSQQANKSRDKVLGQGIATLFGKPADWEDGRLVSQRTIFTRVRIETPFILKRRGGVAGCCKLLGAGHTWSDVIILCSFSCPCRSGHDVPVTLQQDKFYSLFCNFLSLYEWKM